MRACSRITSTEVTNPAGRNKSKIGERSASAFGDVLTSCPDNNVKNSYTRFAACFFSTYEYRAIDRNGQLVGEAAFEMYHQVKLEQKSRKFKQQVKIYAIKVDPKLANITLDVAMNCRDACTSQSEQWNASLTWTPGDAHTATATREHSWNSTSATAAWDPIQLDWVYQGYSPIAKPSAVKVTADDALVQCDNYAITGSDGCAFGTYRPTYLFNSKKYPAAAAHAWLIQESLPSHPGSKKYNKPMNFLPNKDKGALNQFKRDTQKNRDVICPTSYARHPDTTLSHDLVESGGKDVASCDEYAFAGTYQSAGMPAVMNGRNPVTNGDECVQTVAKRVSPGTWKLVDDERYRLPDFTEKCGRSSMSQWQNGGSMNRFNGFAQYFRLQDADEYWVEVPGFSHCAAAAPLVQCTMN
ncbi:hypothetical protein ACFWAP_10980 [Streptomyces goshikiensis]|uniref:hypothetical protein n=1 Tax=Streptomyces goshikiensis TaxID=1942 RepID=UPI003661EAE1